MTTWVVEMVSIFTFLVVRAFFKFR